MSRYTGSKTKLSKRVGRNLFLKGARSFSAKDDFSKKPYKAGEHGNKRRMGKVSQYSKQLTEKQALRFNYGLSEKQLGNLFKTAFVSKNETAVFVLDRLERRLDNVIYRAGLANSRSQARQLVNHGHFTLNDKKANIPSMIVSAGDIIRVKENKAKNAFWSNFQLAVPTEAVTWLDKKDKTVKVVSNPTEDDLPKEFKIEYLVEYYSRKVR